MKKILFFILLLTFISGIFISCENNIETNNDEITVIETNNNIQNETTPNVEAEEVNSEKPLLEVDAKIFDFEFNTMDGKIIKLSDYEGKIIILNFFTTWCTYCNQEMPDLDNINSENDDVVVIAIDVREDKKLVEDYINAGGYKFDVVLDEKGIFADIFYISSLPTSYFIDTDGTFLGGIESMLTLEQMNSIIDQIRNN